MTNNEKRKENDREEIGVKRLLSPKEVAEILRISAKTVNKLEVVAKPHKHFLRVIMTSPSSKKATNILI